MQISVKYLITYLYKRDQYFSFCQSDFQITSFINNSILHTEHPLMIRCPSPTNNRAPTSQDQSLTLIKEKPY